MTLPHKILNLAGGKLGPLNDVHAERKNYIVHVDTMYQATDSIAFAEEIALSDFNTSPHQRRNIYVNWDVFEFMETCRLQFDVITAYRFLEHVPMDKVLYFIYLLSTSVVVGGKVDIIVPNYATLARILVTEEVDDPMFEKVNILLTTEMLNEPNAPHASIWTPERAKKFFELEERFVLKSVEPNFEYDGRTIYLRFQAERVK